MEHPSPTATRFLRVVTTSQRAAADAPAPRRSPGKALCVWSAGHRRPRLGVRRNASVTAVGNGGGGRWPPGASTGTSRVVSCLRAGPLAVRSTWSSPGSRRRGTPATVPVAPCRGSRAVSWGTRDGCGLRLPPEPHRGPGSSPHARGQAPRGTPSPAVGSSCDRGSCDRCRTALQRPVSDFMVIRPSRGGALPRRRSDGALP